MNKINELQPNSIEAQQRKMEHLEFKRINFVNNLAVGISDVIKKKKDELRFLLDLEDSITALDGKDLRVKLSKYLTMNEKNFLKAKELSAYSRINESYSMAESYLDSPLSFQKYGISDNEEFTPYVDKISGGLMLHLPAMFGKKQADRHAVDGRYMYYLTCNLLANYEAEFDKKIPLMKAPVAIFLHHIDTENQLAKTLDADNIDEKLVTDALYGFLLSDDNLLTLWTLHIGIPGPTSFCDLYLMERESLPEWIQNNESLFSEITAQK